MKKKKKRYKKELMSSESTYHISILFQHKFIWYSSSDPAHKEYLTHNQQYVLHIF